MTSDQEPCPHRCSRGSFEGFCIDCGRSLSNGGQSTLPSTADRSLQRPVPEPTAIKSVSDETRSVLLAIPYLWVSTAIGGSTPLQMIRAMQADGISELDALVQMCEAGFDAFCRNLADTANVKGAAGYYKGRERDLYKTELLKVLTEHYGRPMAEQVIDRLEPPVPKPIVREPTRPNPTPDDGISFDVPRYRARDSEMRLAAIIHRWFEFVFSSAEAEQEIRRLQQSGFTKGEALAKICTRGYEESFCPEVAARAHDLRCEHLFQGRERNLFEGHALLFMRDKYGFDVGNEVNALLFVDRMHTEMFEDLTDIDHPTYGGPRALFQVNSAIQEELAREWAIFLTDSGLVAPSARDQLILLAKEFYKTRGSDPHYGTYCNLSS